jgi:hypothetical protein
VVPGHDEIAAVEDPVLRNLWITQRYHELAVAMQACGYGADATWCAFAVWASKTAGSVIRGEELPGLIRQMASDHASVGMETFNRHAPRVAEVAVPFGEHHVARLAGMVAADVATAIAGGNLAVFAELAPPFEVLVEAWPGGTDAAFSAALARLPAGTGDGELGGAFAAYRRAADCPAGSAERPQHVLTANVLAVAHEQRRLQPAISAALDAAVHDPLHQVMEEDILVHVPGPARRALDRLVDDLAGMLETVCRTAITATMLRLVVPDQTFDLCLDVPALPGGLWPPELATVTPAASSFCQWDRTAGTGRPTGATDWAVLDQRMNYIVNLFRSRQRHPCLFDPPFSPAQLDELRAGRLPPGPL